MTNKSLVGIIGIIVGLAIALALKNTAPYPLIGFYLMGAGSATIACDLWK